LAKITLVDRDQSRRVFPLGDRLTIGRDWSNELQLLDVKVSRNHARVIRADNRYFIQDLASHNGTYVNDDRVSERILSSGDRIRIGDSTIFFDDEVAAPPPPEAKNPLSTTVDEKNQTVTVTLHGDLAAAFLLERHDREVEESSDLKRIRRDLTTLFEVSNLLNTDRDRDVVFEKIAERIAEIIPADSLILMEMKEVEGERLPISRVQRWLSSADEPAPRPSMSVINQVIRENRSLLVSDASLDARIMGSESVVMNRLRSVMCVPIRSRDQTLGLIYVTDSARAGIFTRYDLQLLTAIGIEAGIALENRLLFEEMEHLFLQTIEALAATLDAKDGYTAGHSRRVADNAVATALELDISEADRKDLFIGGILHDIGKIGIPDSILKLPGDFSPEHRQAMQRHPVVGAEILRPIPRLKRVSQMVRHHHEWFNGEGYPDRLAGAAIPLTARIIAVSDAFDAITSTRIYRCGRPVETAVEILRTSSGKQFDPVVVEAFLRALEQQQVQMCTEPCP